MTQYKTECIPECPNCETDILVDSSKRENAAWECYDCDIGFDAPDPTIGGRPLSKRSCFVLRREYRLSDLSQRDLADEYELSRSTVYRHLNGRCSHDHD
jgi:transposase-like protein